MQPVPITTKVLKSIPTHSEVHSIQHYVITSVSDIRCLAFYWSSGFLTIYYDHHDFTAILLIVLNINNLLPHIVNWKLDSFFSTLY